MSKNDGGPAHPVYQGNEAGMCVLSHPGMSLRDYFAGQACAGITADSTHEMSFEKMAKWSYQMADAMLAAREGGSHE